MAVLEWRRSIGAGDGMRKSCLVQLTILIVIVAVLSLGLSRTVRRALQSGQRTQHESSLNAPAEQGVEPVDDQAGVLIHEPDLTAAPGLLALVSSRPVMLDDCVPAGLALSAQDLYLACDRTTGQGGYVVRAARDDYAVEARRDVAPTGAAVGGMAWADEGVWLAVSTAGVADHTELLQLRPDTLETLTTVTVSASVLSVAVDDQGLIYTSSCDPGVLRCWSAAGAIVTEAESPDGACYTDIELLRGQLVGVAMVHGQGVLDIIDPSSLTLLARHNLEIVSARGNPLAGNALATDGDVLAFAPDRQPPPTIMAYRLREGRLIDLVPALLP